MTGERYRLRPAGRNDYDFLYRLLVRTMKEYVDETWGWDEAYQQQRFRRLYEPGDYQIIVWEDKDVGALAVKHRAGDVYISEIQIDPDFQGRGIGTAVLRDIITSAQHKGVPVALQVLKVNPARRLYERLGFHVFHETETHFQMTTKSTCAAATFR